MIEPGSRRRYRRGVVRCDRLTAFIIPAAMLLASGCASAPPPRAAPEATPAGAEDEAEPEPTVGRVGQKGHLFFLQTINPKQSSIKTLDLNRLVGERASPARPVILSFAAKYCSPCRCELMAYTLRQQEIVDSGAVLGVVLIDEEAEDRAWMRTWITQKLKLPFAVVEDEFQIVARRYGVRTLPHTVLIDKQGTIQKLSTGFIAGETCDKLLDAVAEVQ